MGQGTGTGEHRWARRLAFGTDLNALAIAIAQAHQQGRRLLDLTVSNPTHCGFQYDAEAILQPLTNPEALRYDAHPLGTFSAREAVARQYYGQRGIDASPNRLLLTTSTSEAYGYLFRLLCDPGDEVLVPLPSYPLFDMLARMEDVALKPYPLLLHDDWRVDFGALEAQLTPRTRAIVMVHPNNPTGHFVEASDRLRLDNFAEEHGLALIVDEVFLDYCWTGSAQPSFVAGSPKALTFVLSGLSKIAALPQMKLAWMVVRGPEELCAKAMALLDFIADSYLSVQAPVQHALSAWLGFAPEMREQIKRRCLENIETLDAVIARSTLLRRSVCQGGWSVLLRCPAVEPDEELALRLIQRAVVVHPGSFYGLPSRGWLVLSILVPTEIFRQGIAEIVNTVEQYATPEASLLPLVENMSCKASSSIP